MQDAVDAYKSNPRSEIPPPSAFARGEISVSCCDRCKREHLPWNLRSFSGKALCTACYGDTLELARAAIKAMPSDEPNRQCRACRALRQPDLGSAWCSVIELGDDRARICANFVPAAVDQVRSEVTGGRTAALDAWGAVSKVLRATLPVSQFDAWFALLEPLELAGTMLTLSVADELTRDWLEQRFQAVVSNALVTAEYEHLSIRYLVKNAGAEGGDPVETVASPSRKQAKAGFNIHYTFAEFIVGSGNRLAHASALACVDKPGQTYNPLVLYGGVGVGKTHLLQAIGQEAIDQGRGEVLYATSETFTNELIHAIREGSTGAFRERYRQVDILLLDDIQFIAGKDATQEEFFHTFNALHQSGKQIVVTSDRPPGELRILEDRLRSRFEWGLLADMQAPDLETRIAILRSKAAIKGRKLPETVLEAVAMRLGNNVRELEGAINRVFARADLLGADPSMETVRTVLGDESAMTRRCRPGDVLQAVAGYFRVKTSDLAGPHRDRAIAYARQMAMYLLREEAHLSLVEVGNHLGGRNHSTVLYGCDKVNTEIKRKGRVKQDVQAIKQLIYGLD